MKKNKDGNFKVKCLNNGEDTGLTVGKIYEFKDGYSQWDDGEKLPQFESYGISRFSNFEDLKKWFDSVEDEDSKDDEYVYKFELISEEINKDGNFKVICIEDDGDWLTKGKIYEVKDGIFPYDNGVKEKKRFSCFQDFYEWNPGMAEHLELISEELENSDSALDYTKSPSIHIYPNKKNSAQTIAILKFGNEITDRVISRCHPDDYYDFKKGAEVAFNKLFNLDVDNNESDKLNNNNIINSNSNGNNSNNKVKKVKRLAQPGEYVIITNASVYDPYKNGDILKIIENRDYCFRAPARYGDNDGQFLYDNEYLVLENYNPKFQLNTNINDNKGNLSQFSDNELIEELKKRLSK